MSLKKLRNKCEIQINNYYIIQYLLNKMRNNNMNNPQYITHTVDDVYNVNKDTVQTLLILKSKRLNNDIITKLISDESDILNEYIKIKEQLRNKSNTEDNTELKSNIKRYLAMKQDIDNKIKKNKYY
jgi:ribosomal protein S17E